jgi:signal transduction histidine kinase
MPRSCQVLFFCLISLVSHAQNQALIDSLRKLADNTPDVIHRYNILNAISSNFLFASPDSAIRYSEEALRIGEQYSMRDLARPLNNMALAYRNLGEYRKSFDLLERAESIARMQGDSIQLGFTNNNQGLLMLDNGEIKQAYLLLIRARMMFENNDYHPGLAEVYSSLAEFYRIQDDFKNAIDMGKRSLGFRKGMRNKEHEFIHTFLQIGTQYESLGDSVNTRLYFSKADSVAKKTKDQLTQLEFSIAYAEYLVRHKKVQEAGRIMSPVYQALSNTRNVRILNDLLFIKGMIADADGRYEDARKIYTQLIGQSGVELVKLRDTYRLLSHVLFKLGKRTEASQMLRQHIILQDSIENIELARRIDALTFQLEIEKRDRLYDELSKEDKLTKEKLSTRKSQTRMLIAVIVTILLFLAYAIYSWSAMKKSNILLSIQKKAIEIQELSIKKQNTMLSTHNRLLSEMNYEKDNLMEILVMDFKSSLETINQSMDPGRTPEEEAAARKKTRSALQLINEILLVENMKDKLAIKREQVELGEILEQTLAGFVNEAALKQITINFKKAESLLLVRTDRVYFPMIVRHLVGNALKFSLSQTMVSVKYGKTDKGWFLEVTDQGPGFTEDDRENLYHKFRKLSAEPTGISEAGHGLGLAIVKLLTDSLKGKIVLDTKVGRGSSFYLVFNS